MTCINKEKRHMQWGKMKKKKKEGEKKKEEKKKRKEKKKRNNVNFSSKNPNKIKEKTKNLLCHLLRHLSPPPPFPPSPSPPLSQLTGMGVDFILFHAVAGAGPSFKNNDTRVQYLCASTTIELNPSAGVLMQVVKKSTADCHSFTAL